MILCADGAGSAYLGTYLNGSFYIEKVVNGNSTSLGSINMAPPTSTMTFFTNASSGGTIGLMVDGVAKPQTITDTLLPAGYAGVGSSNTVSPVVVISQVSIA